MVVVWKYLEEGRQEDVTILMFITNFLYFSEKVQGIIKEVMDMLNINATDAV